MQELIKEVVGILKTGKDIAPEVGKQVLRWRFISSAVEVGIYLTIVLIGVALLHSGLVYSEVSRYGGWTVGTLAKVIVGGALILFIFGVISSLMDCLQIKIAPKVYLTEYCASLIQSK